MRPGLIGALLLTALAHPFGARFAAHATTLTVGPDRVELVYLADVPDPLVASATHTPGADPVQAMADELLSGLLLEVDGRSRILEPVAPVAVEPTEDTHRFTWTLRAALEQPPHEVVFSNGNLPGVPAVFRGRVDVAEGWEIRESSLWRLRDGALALDETDRWRTDPRHRTIRVVVGPAPTGLPAGAWIALGLAGAALLSATAAWRVRGRSAPARRSPPG